jgi:hypothetical protein
VRGKRQAALARMQLVIERTKAKQARIEQATPAASEPVEIAASPPFNDFPYDQARASPNGYATASSTSRRPPACIAAGPSSSVSCGPSLRTATSWRAFIRIVTASGWPSSKSRPVGCWGSRHEAPPA